jgi:amino acid transporter
MASTPTTPDSTRSVIRPAVQVLVATTAMLSFISYWKAAAIVLNDLASSAYYAGGEAEQFIGKTAPWFILAIMLFSYCVRSIYVESCSMFVRGGVYRVVKEALGGTLAKISVSALMFDYILTGPISGVSAGQYLGSLINDLLAYAHLHMTVQSNVTAAVFACIVTLYFWWQNIKGIPESSEKALRIMQLTTVMVVILIAWCGYTVWLRHSALPPIPRPANIHFSPQALGWLHEATIRQWGKFFGVVAIFVALGHSVLAMSGEESLAQVYREIEHPKLKNLKKTGLIIFVYSLVFTSLVSFFAVMIIPDHHRHLYYENLIGGLAMNLEGPYLLRLVFHAFVVVVGTLILSGAVNTAIVGSNGVLNRVSEDGVLTEWFRHPHPRFGTSHRIINLVVACQLAAIIISRGDVTFLANLYAFGVIWSFALKGVAVLVLRYTHKQDREYRVPLNFTIFGVEIPLGLGLITLVLLGIAVVNLFTKPEATVAGVIFTAGLFIAFEISERVINKRRAGQHVELDQFNLAPEADLTPKTVGCRPGNVLVAVSNYYALEHVKAILRRVKSSEEDVVVLHIRVLRRSAAGESELAPEQLFSAIEQLTFTKVLNIAETEGKPVHLVVASSSTAWDGILRAAVGLQSKMIVAGTSAKTSVEEQAREAGLAWERLEEPRPPFTLMLITPATLDHVFYLGPHAPKLTVTEIDLLHKLWLETSERLGVSDLHHHDIVHFALMEVEREMHDGEEPQVLERLRQHLEFAKQKSSRN